MAEYVIGIGTDVGTQKSVNQDSICVKRVRLDMRECVLAVIADGMGGLAGGELASATVIRAFAAWFEERLPELAERFDMRLVQEELQELLQQTNERIYRYGRSHDMQMGTTVTALLLWTDGSYLIVHIGDTRAYEIAGELHQLTEDHSLVAREVRMGRLTEEEARRDSRKNVLLQCVGARLRIQPQFLTGNVRGGGFLLCSDGFRHRVSEQEIFAAIPTHSGIRQQELDQVLRQLIRQNMERGETDNISAVLVQAAG